MNKHIAVLAVILCAGSSNLMASDKRTHGYNPNDPYRDGAGDAVHAALHQRQRTQQRQDNRSQSGSQVNASPSANQAIDDRSDARAELVIALSLGAAAAVVAGAESIYTWWNQPSKPEEPEQKK